MSTNHKDEALAPGAFHRHCAVCFTLIDDTTDSKRSLEGRYYCSGCGGALFRNGLLDSLERGDYKPDITEVTQL